MRTRLSILALIFIFIFAFFFRITHVNRTETSWDALGYYLYLPATFIYHHPLLYGITWLKNMNEKMNLTGTLYQIEVNDTGQTMYFFLMGMALFWLPFFFIGHFFAHLLGYPPDGFSMPYQYSIVIGCIIYSFIGLIFLRKTLKVFFDEPTTAITLLLLVFGTNYIHTLTLANLSQVSILFMLVSVILWYTIKWHNDFKAWRLIVTGICITLMGLIKPTESVIIILPLLWGVVSLKGLGQKFKLLLKNIKPILICFAISLIIISPQLLYWHKMTGKYIYDSYKNAGIGLDFLSPHTLNVLFSYRKGWLLYTPIMFFSLLGFVTIYKKNKPIFYAMVSYFVVSFYIISSWTEWWYGASFSCRPIITAYPVLAVSLGYFVQYILEQKKLFVKLAIAALILFLVFLNLFQWWQFNEWIINPYRTTKKYYWAVFLKTNPNPAARKYLLVNRSFTSHQKLEGKDTNNYNKKIMYEWNFDTIKDDCIKKDTNGNYYYSMLPYKEYSLTFLRKISDITDKDHFWVEAEADIRFPRDFKPPMPDIVMTAQHKGGNYCYYSLEITDSTNDNKWHRYKWYYLSPEWRSDADTFQCYFWKRGQQSFDIDNFKLYLYTPKH